MLDTFVIRSSTEKPPIELAVGVPFTALTKFATHEQEHLTREKPLITKESAEIGEATPVISGHAGKQGAFAVDDFIVGKREDKVFVMMIKHRESEIVLVVLAMDRVAAEVD